MSRFSAAVLGALALGAVPREAPAATMTASFAGYTLDFATPTNPALQRAVESIDQELRARHDMSEQQTAVGVLDLKTQRLALVRPDAIFYAASVPKIAIMLAWFELNGDAATQLDAHTRRELGLMIKQSDNALAAKFSQQLGLKPIQGVLDRGGFYDAARGGGIWVGKHYGKGDERHVDPVSGHSHAATVRRLLRFYLLLEQGKLISAAASQTMREIFASSEIPHRNDKFVKGLAGREVQVLRKAGWWETWFHDTAIVTGENRHYVIVALTHHAKGDDYLEAFAAAVDDALR